MAKNKKIKSDDIPIAKKLIFGGQISLKQINKEFKNKYVTSARIDRKSYPCLRESV